MGLGDEIMALGRADRIHEKLNSTVAICDKDWKPREHDAWKGSLSVSADSPIRIQDAPHVRPYINRWLYGPRAEYNMQHRARAGMIILGEEEKDFARSLDLPEAYAVIEPLIQKKQSSPNKDWGFHKWEEVAARLDFPLVQCVESTQQSRHLPGSILIETPSWRQAAAVIQRSAFVLSHEGGTHHLAASFRKSAIVIFGGFIHPKITGYSFHVNLHSRLSEGPCGNWKPCEHCKQAMDDIRVDTVLEFANQFARGGRI